MELSLSISTPSIVYKNDFNFGNPNSCKSNVKFIFFLIIFGNFAKDTPFLFDFRISIIMYFSFPTLSNYCLDILSSVF